MTNTELTPTEQEKDWEKEFREAILKREWTEDGGPYWPDWDAIESFIRSKIQEAYWDGIKVMEDEADKALSTLTRQHEEEMRALIENIKQGLGEMAPNELLGVKLKRIYPFLSHPKEDK
jgi:hypothetical protein